MTPAEERALAPVTAAEEEKRTGFIELFFDLVFVFAFTQVTTLAKVGTLVDVVLSYFAFRGLLANIDDLRFLLQRLVLLLVPYVLLLAWERSTGNNPFAIVMPTPEAAAI